MSSTIEKQLQHVYSHSGEMLLDPAHITLVWYCEECDTVTMQPLESIVEIGSAVCNDCGDDMTLSDRVLYSSPGSDAVSELNGRNA